jgi:hypothetical protein
MSHRKQKLAAKIGEFMRQYQRKAQGGSREPNDRGYSRKIERKLKRMRPEEFDALVNDSDDETAKTRPDTRKPERDRW